MLYFYYWSNIVLSLYSYSENYFYDVVLCKEWVNTLKAVVIERNFYKFFFSCVKSSMVIRLVVCKNPTKHSHSTRFYINLLSSPRIRYSCTISVIDPLSLVCKQQGYHNQNTCFTDTYMPYLTDSLLGYFVYNSKFINYVSNTPCHRPENFMMIRPNFFVLYLNTVISK